MYNELNKLLVEEVLKWWKEHEYDTYDDQYEEYNVYNDDPKFVTIAKRLKEVNKYGYDIDEKKYGRY